MGDERSERESARPMDPNAPGKTAGANTQSQGGIGAKLAQAAREEFDAATGSPAGPLGRVDPPRTALDSGGGDAPADGRAHHAFSGDDGARLTSGNPATPAARQPGAAADLRAQQDARLHGLPRDPADRTTGADSPNRGGTAGAPGRPARIAPAHVPGQGVRQGRQSGNDPQRDPQI